MKLLFSSQTDSVPKQINQGQFWLVNRLTRVPIDSHHLPIIFPYRRCCHHFPTFSRAFVGWFPHPPNLTAFCARVPRLSKGIKKAKRARWALGPGRGWWTPQTQWNFFEFWWLSHFSEKNMRDIWYMSLSVGMMNDTQYVESRNMFQTTNQQWIVVNCGQLMPILDPSLVLAASSGRVWVPKPRLSHWSNILPKYVASGMRV